MAVSNCIILINLASDLEEIQDYKKRLINEEIFASLEGGDSLYYYQKRLGLSRFVLAPLRLLKPSLRFAKRLAKV